MNKHFDVIIIGSGAGGGTLARHLAPSGKSILILERGDWLKREALNWALGRGSRSGRVAWQFARDFAGRHGGRA